MRGITSRAVALVVVLVSVVGSAFAGPAREFDRRIARTLATASPEGKTVLREVSLGRESLDTIELEPMEVWAKDAKIIAFGAAGEQTLISPPDVRYFKGTIAGESDSAVFFSRSADGSIRGLILIGERRWTVGTGIRKKDRGAATRLLPGEGLVEPDAPLLISEIDELDELNDQSESWMCDVNGAQSSPPSILRLEELSSKARTGQPATEAGLVSGATYQLRIAIETDNEFCAAFSNNTTTITTYIGDLIGKSSIVYSRDLKTTLVLGETHLRTGGAGTDPWTATNSSEGLAEFGTYWHNNYSSGYPDPDGGGAGVAGGGTVVPRSSAVFLSGKTFSAGIAWVDVLCENNFFCGTTGSSCGSATYANVYAGAYAFNSSSGSVTTTVPDPEATVNGVQYGLPANANFWMLLEVMHELGHNVASPHSSCIELSAEEKTMYGVTRDYVDLCLSGGTGCYSGATSAPAEKGTIMSYCHNFTSGGFRQSRYLFGKAGEPSEKMLPVFRLGEALNTASPSGLEGCTPNATITSQSQPVSCTAGRTASVAACSGCTYSWQITGGTITSATNIAAITYTPTDALVTLTVTILTSRGCGITASKSITASCAAYVAPSNVVATATSTTSVSVSWTAPVTGSTPVQYDVYRSSNGTVYSQVGFATHPTLSFTDSTAAANTAYLYKVRSAGSGGTNESADSNRDLATTVIFTDDPLVAGVTLIKAVHITQLRTAVNAVRTLAGLSAATFTDPTLTSGATKVKAVHVTELRAALDTARSTLTLPAISYGETITTTTTVKASHITELRNGVK